MKVKIKHRTLIRLGATLLIGALAAGGAAIAQGGKFPEIGPLPAVPAPADNPMSKVKVELGKLLFFDPRLSGDASTSCASCHSPKAGWGDGGDLSRGYPGTQHWRNSQTILNSAYYKKLFWAGEVPSLEAQAKSAATGNTGGNGDQMMMEERLRQIPVYVKMFREAFGEKLPTIGDAWRAISAFERTIVSKAGNVPFDRYMNGDKGALSASAKRGLALFKGKAACIQCHNGPLFADGSYHNLGLPQNEAFEEDPLRQITLRYQNLIRGVPEKVYRKADRDYGLYYTTKQNKDKGKFRTPSLRELKYTAPFMHNGVFFELEEVIDFYNKGESGPGVSRLMKPLKLFESEKKDLEAFLLSLSSDKPILMPKPDLPPYAAMR